MRIRTMNDFYSTNTEESVQSDRSPSSREEDRQEIVDLTSLYLEEGGDIQHIEPGVRTKVYKPWNASNL